MAVARPMARGNEKPGNAGLLFYYRRLALAVSIAARNSW
jgi:hypothetical protein